MKKTPFHVLIFFLALFGAFSETPAQTLDIDDPSVDVEFLGLIYNIESSAGSGGTISPRGDYLVFRNDDETFTISPLTGYGIKDVLVDGVSVGPVATYTLKNIKSDHTIRAEFFWLAYQIKVSAGDGGTISPSGEISVHYGGGLTFSISPDTGYEIKDVLVNGKSVGAVESYTFKNVTSEQSISAKFEQLTHVITASSGKNGAISPSGEVKVEEGGSQAFAITPEEGYTIVDVRVNDVPVGGVESYTFSDVSTDQSIAATFARREYQVTASAGDGGTISPSGEIPASHGDDLTFSIYPYAEYEVEDVLVNGESVGPVAEYTFENIKSNQTIEAFFTYIEPPVVNGDPDGDGIDDEEEAGPDGDDPAYDGNGDGLPDCEQANVASFYDVQDHYVTIDVAEPGVLKDVFPMTGADIPEDVEFPCGLFHFILEGVTDPNVTITLPESVSANSYYKFGPTPDNTDEHWYEFMYDRESGTGAVIDGQRIVLYFVDGKRGDDDLDGTNQIVIDQGGPAVAAEVTPDTTPDDSGSDGGETSDTPADEGTSEEEGCFITSTLEAPEGWGLVALAAITFLAGCIRKTTGGSD